MSRFCGGCLCVDDCRCEPSLDYDMGPGHVILQLETLRSEAEQLHQRNTNAYMKAPEDIVAQRKYLDSGRRIIALDKSIQLVKTHARNAHESRIAAER